MKHDASWLFFGALLAVIGAVMAGCSGIELHATTGIRRVDEHSAAQKTHREAVPWKCYFTNCHTEVQGS